MPTTIANETTPSVPARVEPIARTSLAETAYEAILDAILSGRLPVGEAVSEVSLAADLRISRTPVAQAIQRLAAVGLIDRPPGRPPRIARFDRQNVIELYEMRQLLEAEAAYRAATRLPTERLAALRAEVDDLLANPRKAHWAERAIEFDIRFHDELASAAGNHRLGEHIRQYRLLVRAFCRSTGRREVLTEALREHRRILEALGRRDPEKARAAMSDHIERRLRVVLAELFPEEPRTAQEKPR
jgi:DNA-binding GntR family transcriptional regulator